jgi:hypothetical protein
MEEDEYNDIVTYTRPKVLNQIISSIILFPVEKL